MNILSKLLKKQTIILLSALLLIGSIFVYAYVDRTVYTTQQLVIIPGKVTSDSWLGLESVLVQDISEYSLYQDFTEKNSAYISELGLFSSQESPTAPTLENPNEVVTPPGDGTGTSSDDVVSPLPGEPGQSETETVTGDTESETIDPTPVDESTPEPETVSVKSPGAAEVVWGVFNQNDSQYPLAQGILTEDTPVASALPELSADVNTQGAENSSPELSGQAASDQTVPGESPVLENETELVAPDQPQLFDSVGSTTDPDADGTPDLDSETEVPQDTSNDYVLEPCLVEAGCATHSMLFSDFSLPDFESGTVLDSIALRLSLAAQTKNNRGSGPQRFLVEYTYDTSTSAPLWATASVLDIDDEISNSINGGYYLLSLSTPQNAGDIANLRIKISYQGTVSDLETAYVEGMWLEVTSGTFFEEGAGDPYKDTLTYGRDLLAPELNTLNSSDLDPTLGTLPSFTLSYDTQQNFFNRIFRSIFSDNTFVVERITLEDSEGVTVDVPFTITYHDDTTWTMTAEQMPQKLKPGKYRVTVDVLENDVRYTDDFEYYWGLLAVNTPKSMYFPNEDVVLNLAALTDKGDTICDAHLELKIIDPKGNIFEVPVEQSGSCGPNNVTDVPDYLADFTETGEWGKYTIQLQHRNVAGEIVHKITDSFEVRDYIPFDITRTAPTRIYPPAPYEVNLNVKANRAFTGDVSERVPRGFVIEGLENATLSSLPEYTLITWNDITMAEGDELNFSYTFDAPDISPYMYLLGPLDMDGFAELRQWQVASDALNNIGWFTGTRTVASSSLNTAASPMQWSTSSIDNYYYTHSTSSNSQRVTLRQRGDYMVSINLPQQRSDILVSRTRGAVEVRKNGVVVPQSLGRSGVITGGNGVVHSESSSNVSFLLTEVSPNDYIEVFVENLTTIDAGDVINVSGLASMYVEYLSPATTVFAATATRTTNSTNLNQLTAFDLEWTETRQDSGFIHSNTITPQNITLTATGTYMVHVNIPLQSTAVQSNISGRVKLDGVTVLGGRFQQGYVDGPASESDADSSIHWSGVILATTTNRILTIATEREANAGTTTIPVGFVGSILVEKLPDTGVIALRGRGDMNPTGTNFNSATASSTRFNTQLAYDNVVFSHSTNTNSHEITVNESGDYLLNFTDSLTSATNNTNSRITVSVGGVPVTGAQTKSNYVRALNGHNESSANLVFLLSGITAGQIVTVNTQQEGVAGTQSTTTDTTLLLWKKASLNFRAPAPSMFSTPFDNIQFASTTPYFDFESSDPDGTSKIQYEFSISTSSDFATATVRVSGADAGFTNTASSSDTSPFIEANRIRFQLQAADALTDLTTYYWRVRARDVSGSGQFGDYSTTQSLTVNLGDIVPNWYQTLSGQFKTNSLVGAVSPGLNNNVTVDGSVSSEILVGYGDGTNATPRYRLWNGTSWGIEQNAIAGGGTINWVRTAAGVSRDEYVMLTLDQASSSYAQIYNATSSSWGNQTLLSNTIASSTRQGIAVGYESVSGDVMAVSCSNTKDPVYRIWNGSTWSATSTITVSLVGACQFLEIASDPSSDEMILVVRDALTQYQALVWNGTAWVANQVVGTGDVSQPGRVGIGLKYEKSGDQAVIAVTNGVLASVIYTTWDGTSFTSNTTQVIGNDFEFGRLVADPNSDNMALCYIDEDVDIGVLRWNGGVWSTFFELETAGNSQAARPVDCEFETVAGRSGNLLVSYSDTVAARYRVFNYASSTWSAEATIAGIGTAGLFWGQTERAGDGTIVSMWHDDVASGDEIESSYFNGTSWATKQSIAPNPSSIIGVPSETFEMAAKRFQFTQGVVRSTPINFTYVPGQATWGDVSFSTTEPFGTDVLVRVRYTSVTTCDTYIPNGALAGNLAGFGAESVPVVLTALSTTTYNQICLEATATTFGSASASLNDWTVAWQRKPKLIQNNYRWYDNGSFLTPTDPWPAGVTDLAENTPLTSGESVNINDVIRLRLALEGTNVPLPTSTTAFKLQSAEGLSCNFATNWTDVGAVGSTTAVWRGYANAIVGSDWLSAAWLRRSKITIEGTLVSGVQTDFPVYVNLDDLPDSFFANVQSDGDDIRITTANGLTEVPFELVSINTTTKKGELHFKATLASTTDTDFYIYYSNPVASGYAVTAPYGRNNVWTNGYEAVYHLGTSPASSMTDSTSNGRTLTMSGGMTAANSTSSVLGNGVDFDGVNDQFANAGFAWTTNPVTVTAWNNVATAETQNANLFGFIANGNERLATHGPWGDAILYWDYGTCCSLPGRLTANYAAFRNKWTHIGLVSQGGAGAFMGIYFDGALISSSATSDNPNVTLTNFALGSGNGGAYHNGRIDEFRIASVARSAGYIATERTNQSNPTGFYALSAEELIGDGATIPATVLSGSDYPETYEEGNPTNNNRFGIPVGNASEWDFTLQNNAALPNTNYCFRMVYADGSTLNTYTQYPRLITNAPPLSPTLSAPFDNEQFASTTPWFEFAAQDEVSDEVSYEIMVDTDINFGTPDVTSESNANFALFTNLASPSERGLYTTGQTIRFVPSAPLSTGATYYWRVRAKDDNGSGTYSPWSVPSSFTIASGTFITTWFQTTGEQFNTNNLSDAITSTSTGDVGIDTSFTNATMTTSFIDYDDRDVGNAWGEFSFVQNTTAGTIRHYVEYRTTGESFALVPDALVVGNSSGLTSSPVSLAALDPALYNELRIVSVLSGTPSLPRIQALTVTWGQNIEIPTHNTPFDNAKVATTSPTFTFVTSDPQSDALEYEFQYSNNSAFTSSSTFNSGVDGGFVNTASSSDVTPFTSNEVVRYTVSSPLINGNTYFWRVRARDPLGANTWSAYSSAESFTVDSAITVSVWHQTVGDQFLTNTNQDIETTAGGAKITSVVSGVMTAYGEGTGQAPQYRLWNGTSWSNAASADTVGAQIRWTRLDAAPTRPEYALATVGTDLDINIQIYDGTSDSWGNLYEIYTESIDAIKRRFDIEYETSSGDLLAVTCEGTEARFSIWNGTTWSATTSLPLTNINNCEWVSLAADPISDEIIAVFRHTNTSATDYEALVWNGSTWGNSLSFGNINENSNEGIAVNYEASGGQALAVVSNDTAASFFFSAWNGSSWTTPTTSALSNDFEFGSLKRDVGTDNMIFCYIDDATDISVKTWNGSAWSVNTVMTIDGNSKLGQPVDCEYQTLKGTDGDAVIPYSDSIDAKYQTLLTATGTFSGEFTMIGAGNINDSFNMHTVRGGDGTIHAFAFDDGSAPDRYSTSQWNGSAWSTLLNFSTNPSITAAPFNGAITAAAQIYPNFTTGTIRSTAINFADGSGPRWERMSWNDSTPSGSDIRYRLYYKTASSSYSIVPDSALAGNAAGFTNSPISIATLDRTIYSVLKLDAELICNSGICPTIQDWSVEWSEGINVSGTAYEYDASTTVATGTVAVAVNGVLQSGKTAVIGGAGTWLIPNVTAFAGDAITVFIDGVADVDEAVGVTTYDGVGDVTLMELSKRHLTFGSTDAATSSNALFGGFDNSDDEDVFFMVSGSSTLALCVEAGCADAKLKIKSTAVYMPGANISVHDIVNLGRFVPEANTVRVSGSWLNTGIFVPALSTVIFTATTSVETITSTSSATSTFFHNVTFGETSGISTWSANKPLDITGSLAVDFGTFARGTTTINLEQNLRIGVGGFMTGLGTTTFDGSGSHTWTDTSASSTNVGDVVVDGLAKTVTLGGNVAAQSVTIGADDTLNASGSGFNINVVRAWTNNNSFIPQSGTVTFVGTTTGTIARGTSAFNNITFSGVGGAWSFSTSTLAINNNFTIATGTVTLPTGTTTIGGNFSNTGGTFLHNNGEVRMTSATAGKTITQRATTFLNAFYDLVFTGSGAWSFTESAATTTRNFNIQNGTVTLASSTITVGGDFNVTGSGSFLHNSGELVLLVQGTNTIRANGSNLNNLRIKGLSASSWYNNAWSARQPIVINSAQVPTTVTDFPVYVNLANLPAVFFSTVMASGTDIRVTTSDGLTEVPHELVAIDSVAKTGELHFKAPTVSSTTNTTFYIYYGNGGASSYASSSPFGRNNVWTNGFEAVYHLGTSPAATMIDSTANGRNLTSSGGMGAGNSVAGAIGNSVDFDGANDMLINSSYAWTATPITVTAWSNVAVSEVKIASMFGLNEGAGADRLAAHAPYADNILYWDYGNCCGATGRITANYTTYRDKWTHVGLVSAGGAGAFMGIYLDGAQVTTGAASDDPAVLTGFAIGAAGSGGGGGFHDGRVDEFRLASVARTFGWLATEENNQSSSTAFYSVGASQSRTVRVFTDTNTTILGNYVSELGGDATFPTGVLGVAGSFTNTANFTANNGTVRFNSTGGSETIAVGSSTFATLDFNSGSGDFTIVQNATATVAINLTSASAFTLQSGLTLAALGTFSNAANGANTTWTGATLSLSGADGAINLKSHGGDAYATILTNGDTDIIMWNSSAAAYTTASTSSIYSADHAAVDGDLHIYGDYVRTTGTEFWSYATDFDGAALTGTTSRQVDVRIATTSRVGFVSASLNMVGVSGASSTIDAVSGTYTLSATNTTITAANFTVAGTNASGLQLNASTTLATFQDGLFTVVPGRTGITMSSTTVAHNPSAQYQRVDFATTTAGSGTNITLNGTTSAFVWFRLGTGNLYGENFDSGDANPGSIRWDDSSNSITISGVVYADDGVTPLGAPTCNGTTPNVRVVVNNGAFSASTTCAAGTGAYTLTGVNYIGDPKITVYLNTNGGVNGSVVTKTPSGNITNLNIYAGRVITRHQDIAPLTIADMTLFDNDDDSDIQFVATTTGPTTLRVIAPNSLFVFATTTFAPGGNVTLTGNASSSPVEGTLQLGTAATFSASGTETHTLAGRLVLATTSVLVSASSTFIFNASTTGKSITSPNLITFNTLQFTGVGGGWNITAPLIVQANMDIATGTVSGTSNITLNNGSLSGDGTLSLGSGTTTIARSNTFGGARAWTVNNLILGNGLAVGTTTRIAVATTTILGRLTISPAHFLVTGSSNWDLAGTGSVLVESGTLLEDTSTFRYSGASAQVLSTTYYNLDVNAGAGTPTYTAIGTGIGITNNLTIGGQATTVFDTNTSDPALIVGGSISVRSNGTLSASNIATTSVGNNFTNLGTFSSNGGLVAMVGAGSHTIAAGNSSFGSLLINNAAGTFTVSQNATTTVALNLLSHANFTQASGTTMAIGGTFTNTLGGAATTFASSTLSFFGGGTKNINAKTVGDVYQTLVVATSTNIKMWNSSATSYIALGSIYSQDHAAVDGNLNIYGTYAVSAGTDYWSYATDFDGAVLASGTRKVDVSLASGSSAVYSGGGLEVIGTSTASTTITNQGTGTYGLTLGGTASTTWDTVLIRNINAAGVVFSGTPNVVNFSRTDHLIGINSGTGMTVAGSVIDVNQAKNFTNNVFGTSTGVVGTNVTATGTTISSWRFTNHSGTLSGEVYDNDPAGDPGYVVWDDSAALITVSGNVYSDEGVTVSPVCNGVTQNILLRVAGLTTYTASCDAGTGAYSITNVAFSPADTLTVYIDNNIRKAVTVSADPVSSISNMHLYENRVIVRHENTSPLSVADMAVWDSSDDGDIVFTAIDAGTDTLTLPADQKLLIWNGKTFEPVGNVSVAGGGGGGAADGTLEAQTNATFRALGTETHVIGGSMIFGTGATFTAGQSTTTFTTTGASRIIDVNGAPFHNVAFTGSGSWTVTDATFTTNRSLTQSNGAITFGNGTTTIGASFNATAGSFLMGGSALVFTSTSTGNVVRFDDSSVPSVRFAGTGGAWSMTDTNATSTGSLRITSGTVTLPPGTLGVGSSFENLGGTIVHNTADIIMNATSSALLRASSSNLFAVRFAGVGPFIMSDVNLTLADSLTMSTGTLTLATGTLSVGGDFLVASGTVNNASGTVLFNATTVGKTVNFGNNDLYNVVFGSGTGGWNFTGNATTTNNFSITGAGTFTKEANTNLNIGGVFTNTVGGANTTWATTTLRLYGVSGYTINTKTLGGDVYGTLEITNPLAIRAWNSAAAITTVLGSASLYSQDHAAVDGALTIYGTLGIATTTEYWNYANDFDGTVLAGAGQRQVNVRLASGASTTVTTGSLQIVGTAATSTTVAALAGGSYGLIVNGGTLNAQYYSMTNVGADGLTLTGSPTITNLSNGAYTLTSAGGSLITVAASVLDANASKIFTGVSFATSSAITGFNVTLTGSTSNAWRFSGSAGTIGGEAFDVDGLTACGSIRFDNSGCLLTQQTHYRWRNDDGGEGAVASEWFNTGFDYRQRVRVVNNDLTSYASTAIKLAVTYDSNMQADFDDLRFTSGDGLTAIPYWIERYTASTDAVVWVRVPNVPASETATVFMYYGSSTVASQSSGATTFAAFDDFEDNNITEYSGDTGIFQTDTAPVYGGIYALEAQNKSGRTTDGIFRTTMTVSQGQIIRWMQYIDTAGSGDDACALFGVQSPGVNNNNYAICLQQFGVDRMVIAKNIYDNDSSGTVLASSTASFVTGWYEVEVDWRTNNSMTAYLRTAAGALVTTASATDSSYTTGGVGFTFWFQNGSWDSYTARARAMINPTVYFGAEQTDGGATWEKPQNVAGSGVTGVNKRLRFAIENSGLDIVNQTFRLEAAPKGVSPSCEAVPTGNFTAVPNQASCGSAAICMQTSTFVADGDQSTDHLASTSGAFSAGKVIESPSNITTALNLNQNKYTELEYVLTPTINATSTYCLRVTNGGTPLDFYNKVAELGLQFDPVFGAVTLNNGNDISLIPGTTTTIYASSTVTDLNGTAGLMGSSTIYRSNATPSCTANTNTCYKAETTASSSCTFTNCSGNTCTLVCRADIFFHAEPTDDNVDTWLAYLEIRDPNGGYDIGTPPAGIELISLRSMSVNNAINYGSLALDSNTGAFNPTTTIANAGNVAFDIDVFGTDLTDGGSSRIQAEEQKFATSTFDYSICSGAVCTALSSTTPFELDVDIAKPVVSSPLVTDEIYWGIRIQSGINSAPHSGINVFTAVAP